MGWKFLSNKINCIHLGWDCGESSEKKIPFINTMAIPIHKIFGADFSNSPKKATPSWIKNEVTIDDLKFQFSWMNEKKQSNDNRIEMWCIGHLMIVNFDTLTNTQKLCACIIMY